MRKEVKSKVMKEVEVIDKEVIICDCCRRVIFDKDRIPEDIVGRFDRIAYYNVVTGHDDWGNDSCDSIEENDYCSDDCLRKAFEKWLKENKNSFTGYFKVYTNSVWFDKNTKDFHVNENIQKG